MKKFFKIATKCIGAYAVLNTLVWAWVGSGLFIKRYLDDSHPSITECFDMVFDEAAESWGQYIRLIKSLFNK